MDISIIRNNVIGFLVTAASYGVIMETEKQTYITKEKSSRLERYVVYSKIYQGYPLAFLRVEFFPRLKDGI